MFGITIHPLENFLLKRINEVVHHQRAWAQVFDWLFHIYEEQDVVAHLVMNTLSTRAMKGMLRFASAGNEGAIFSFLKLKSMKTGIPLGHALFRHADFSSGVIVQHGVSEIFFTCLKKLSKSCFDEIVAERYEGQSLHELIEALGEANPKIKGDYAWSASTHLETAPNTQGSENEAIKSTLPPLRK